MNLVRWNPSRELEEMTDSLLRFFARPHTWRSTGKEMMPVADWRVSVGISESDGDFHITTKFPGLKHEAMRGILDKGRFTLQGEPKEES
jgi:HSP20 family protein